MSMRDFGVPGGDIKGDMQEIGGKEVRKERRMVRKWFKFLT
jgi:hypothetical protein